MVLSPPALSYTVLHRTGFSPWADKTGMLLPQGSDLMNFPGNWEVSGSLREPWRPAGATSQLTVEGSARYLKAVLLGRVTLCPG